MARIPDQLVREILDRTDIVSVVGEHVRLTRKGGRWVGLCPFHGEKTPSFHVDPDKGLFYCFGCQKGGSVVQFLMELEKQTFPEVMEDLAKRAGIALEVEEAPSGEEQERKALYELYERLAGTFQWFLAEHPSGAAAREILRSRGLSEPLVKDFRLGYSPPDRRWLFAFLRSKGYSEPFLAQSGLFAANAPAWPIFAGRLIFPIADQRGRIIAFGGRIMEGEGPKYINSPDTRLFRKQDCLFALDKALPAIRKEGAAIICEGYMDALSFHAAGLDGAVAPLGTAFTASQARLLKRWATRVLLCFDADEPGQKAAERACSMAASAGLEALVVSLPGGKDASEILEKEGPGTLQRTADFAINGDEFLVKRAGRLFDAGTTEGKARAAAYLYPYADALDSEVKRSAFLEFASREFGANPISIKADYDAAKRVGHPRAGHDAERLPGGGGARESVARTPDLVFMSAVVLNPGRFAELRAGIAPVDLDDFRARDLFIALEEGFRADDLRPESLLARVENEDAARFVREASASGELSVNPDRLISDGIASARRRSLERMRERVLSRMAAFRTGGNTVVEGKTLNDLLYEKMHLDAELENMKGERDERS